jgi:hypothetical protein
LVGGGAAGAEQQLHSECGQGEARRTSGLHADLSGVEVQLDTGLARNRGEMQGPD